MTRKSALLVIDAQVGILDGIPAYNGDGVLKEIAALLKKARDSGTPIIFVQHDGPEGHPLEVDTTGWNIHPDILPAGAETVVRKQASDSFYETRLQQELEDRNVDHLIITGCMTEYCVDTACRRAVTLGYDVTLVSDGHTTADNELLKARDIIAHHNALLDGFDAGPHRVTVKPAAEVDL